MSFWSSVPIRLTNLFCFALQVNGRWRITTSLSVTVSFAMPRALPFKNSAEPFVEKRVSHLTQVTLNQGPRQRPEETLSQISDLEGIFFLRLQGVRRLRVSRHGGPCVGCIRATASFHTSGSVDLDSERASIACPCEAFSISLQINDVRSDVNAEFSLRSWSRSLPCSGTRGRNDTTACQ